MSILSLDICCGCASCVQRCPKQCIILESNNEGFFYPVVDVEKCVECGLCEKVCPVLHETESREPLNVFAAINEDEGIRKESSSGGVFTALAENVISEGGVVFGARFDDKWQVQLDCTDNIDGLKLFRGSKYVQARVEDTYKRAESYLKQGRKVLFSGTPCQIAGLRLFLGREYDNLLCVDFVCHGVPSPKVWERYLRELVARKCEKNSVLFSCNKLSISEENAFIKGISFRDKKLGWKKFSFVFRGKLTKATAVGEKNTVLFSAMHRDDVYMRAFLSDLILRPSCYDCRCKSGKSGADITIADFWGIQYVAPEMDDDKGTSLVLINSNKGDILYNGLKLRNSEQSYRDAVRYNPSIVRSVKVPAKRELFWRLYNEYDDLEKLIDNVLRRTIMEKVKGRIKSIIKKIIKK